LASGKKKQDAPGFPIFPHSKRILEVPLDGGNVAPAEVSLQFDNFRIDEKLRVNTNNNLEVASGSTSVTEGTGEKR
jgi:hypothetical protein